MEPLRSSTSGQAKLVLPGRALDSASLHELIVGEGVTVANGVPTIWLGILDHLAAAPAGGLGRLDRILCGGMAPPPDMLARLRRLGVRTIHAWGMTETTHASTAISALPGTPEEEEAELLLSQGNPIYGSAIRVVDDAGRPVPRDGRSVGRLQVKGHWIASAYFRRDDPSLMDGGWMNTGDVAAIRQDGAMRITDRDKDVIKSGGEWISSVDIENAALAHPDVAEAAAIAVAHPRWQERPLLLVIPAEGRGIDPEALLGWLGDRVPKWWLPDRILPVAELPRTATGKVRKNVLREQYADILATAR